MSGNSPDGTRDWSRRDVLAVWMGAGAALSAQQQRPSRPPLPDGRPAPPSAFTAEMEDLDQVDHLLWGAPNLEAGITWMEQRTGLKAVVGGRHPGQGTMNALLSLGPRRYLEIIGPDPEQAGASNPRIDAVRALTAPRLIGWAAGSGDLAAVSTRATAAGLEVMGPVPGSRQRPDGTTLQWRALAIVKPQDPLLPFFIEWAPGTTHPSQDSPTGCSLREFALSSPSPTLSATLKKLGLAVHVRAGAAGLHATIRTPKGDLQLD